MFPIRKKTTAYTCWTSKFTKMQQDKSILVLHLWGKNRQKSRQKKYILLYKNFQEQIFYDPNCDMYEREPYSEKIALFEGGRFTLQRQTKKKQELNERGYEWKRREDWRPIYRTLKSIKWSIKFDDDDKIVCNSISYPNIFFQYDIFIMSKSMALWEEELYIFETLMDADLKKCSRFRDDVSNSDMKVLLHPICISKICSEENLVKSSEFFHGTFSFFFSTMISYFFLLDAYFMVKDIFTLSSRSINDRYVSIFIFVVDGLVDKVLPPTKKISSVCINQTNDKKAPRYAVAWISINAECKYLEKLTREITISLRIKISKCLKPFLPANSYLPKSLWKENIIFLSYKIAWISNFFFPKSKMK